MSTLANQLRWALIAATVAAVPVCTLAQGTKKECKYPAPAHATVNVVNEAGTVALKPASGRQIVISTTASSSKAEIDCNQAGNRVDAITRFSQKPSEQEARVDYEVAVPQDANVTVRDASGEIRSEGLKGDVSLRSDTASVDASNVTDGHLHIVTVTGAVALTNVSGGHVDVISNGGNIQLNSVDASKLSVSTTTGNIAYDGNFGSSGEYFLTSHSGNIDVALPSTASVDLDARASHGAVQNDFPLQQKPHMVQNLVAGRSFAGTSNSGSSSVQLRSFSGTIRVKKR